MNLKQGRHTLTIENVAGFNAINTFGIIPSSQTDYLQDKVSSLANRSNNMYLLEAESSFYNDKGRPIVVNNDLSFPSSSTQYLFGTDKVAGGGGGSITNRTIEVNEDYSNFKTGSSISGQIRVPENADLLRLEFLASPQNEYHNGSNPSPVNLDNTQSDRDYHFENLRIYPAIERQGIIASDFERSNVPIPLAELRNDQWVNHAGKNLTLSVDTKNVISGNASLRVDVGQGNQSEWSMITTDNIPINDKSYYDFSLAVSAREVNQLYGRVTYYDEDGQKMGSESISKRRDGTFNDLYSASIVPPSGAKYLRFEILIRPDTADDTSYSIDNIRFEEIRPPVISFDKRLNDLETMNANLYATNSSSFSFGTEKTSAIVPDNNKSEINYSTPYSKPQATYSNIRDSKTDQGIMIQKTKPIPVIGNSVYNFSISIKEKQTNATTESTKSENVSMGGNPAPVATAIAYFSSSTRRYRKFDKIWSECKWGQGLNFRA